MQVKFKLVDGDASPSKSATVCYVDIVVGEIDFNCFQQVFLTRENSAW